MAWRAAGVCIAAAAVALAVYYGNPGAAGAGLAIGWIAAAAQPPQP